MATTKVEVLFGKIAVSCGFINEEQLAKAVEGQEKAPDGTHLGKIMVDMGFLSDEELMTRCLSDFDREIADTDDFDKYAEFIRTTAKMMLKFDAE